MERHVWFLDVPHYLYEPRPAMLVSPHYMNRGHIGLFRCRGLERPMPAFLFLETWPSFFYPHLQRRQGRGLTFRDSKSKNQLANGAPNRDSKREKLFTKVDSNLAGTFLLLCVSSSWNLESGLKEKDSRHLKGAAKSNFPIYNISTSFPVHSKG